MQLGRNINRRHAHGARQQASMVPYLNSPVRCLSIAGGTGMKKFGNPNVHMNSTRELRRKNIPG